MNSKSGSLEESASTTSKSTTTTEEPKSLDSKETKAATVCKLLQNLPATGAFSNVDIIAGRSKSPTLISMPTHQTTYNSVGPQCRIVKNDTTNPLVRALRVQKRRDRENMKIAKQQNKRPAKAELGAAQGFPTKEGDGLKQRKTSKTGRPSVFIPPRSDRRFEEQSTSSTTSISNDQGGRGLPAPARFHEATGGLHFGCVQSPRLGATRVRTPPPTQREATFASGR
mmetsp:Transcript_5720/g.10709  ORF Transcript_5720/g.10709 Transcript_5720/m.10709 type:complete len:226 (-) Transcript_5720:227-904(-)|eukprot:CAMPEP_0184537340 /NCGR_PEP_ID=MMETSP0198_2-20121128/16970_1 /TAXON_ID=1112570 /ORGANISM="Thraustochytrium sp., Strain LLF1b" /LENGTH=225 /DNA_ID=CAMNT_0026930641 /DNA_START=178 /DNA_END=855 /DNA_ORIENTATION=+